MQDPIVTQLILGAVNVITTFPGLYIVERFGRRRPMFIGALWQAAWLLVFAAVGTARNPEEHSSSGIVMIVAACMFIASFAVCDLILPSSRHPLIDLSLQMTWGPMAWVVIGETFPLRTRARQASIATAGNWLGNFMIAFLTPFANSGISYAFGFVFFGTNLAAALLVYFFLFETKSLSLENVDAMYSDPTCNAMKSSKWVPIGYTDRNHRDDNFIETIEEK